MLMSILSFFCEIDNDGLVFGYSVGLKSCVSVCVMCVLMLSSWLFWIDVMNLFIWLFN